MSYIFLDTETHSKENPILIQLAYIRTKPDGMDATKWLEDEVCNQLFSTGGPKIEFWAMAVHHITEKQIEGLETFNQSYIKDVSQKFFYEHGYILIAHNAPFDVWVLKNHGVEVPTYICTLKLARYVYPEFEAHNLQYLRYRLGLEFDKEINPHDAMSDVYVLEKLFYHLFDKIWEALEKTQEAPVTGEQLNKKMIEITRAPSLLYRCVFWKHAGKLWSEVPRDYLEWIAYKSDISDEDVMHTARYYLSGNTSLPV